MREKNPDNEQDFAREDALLLRRLGYTQELFRTLSGFSNFAISFSVISILTGSITLYGYGLNMSGPKGIILGWVIVSLFSIPIALSMAELASSFPTAGALYHWASILGNRHIGWFTACFNYLGQFAVTAGIDYGLADFLVSLFGGNPQSPVKIFVYGVLLLSHALINHYGIRLVAILNDISAWYHVVGVFLLVGTILWVAPQQEVSFLWRESTTSSYSYGWAFCLGLLLAQWTLTGYDASAHVSEETLHVAKRVPVGIITAVVSSGILGLIMLSVITLAIPDLEEAQKAANPFIYVMEVSLGNTIGKTMVWLCVIAMWFCGLSSLTSNSRMLFAFARDGGVPFSKMLSTVSRVHKTPAPAIWCSAILAFFIALYGKAYSVVVAMATVLLFISYLLPILLAWKAQREGKWKESDKGEFRLGKWSRLCNGIASLWILFAIWLFMMPPNEQGFYATGTLSVSLVVLYCLVGQKRFKGMARG